MLTSPSALRPVILGALLTLSLPTLAHSERERGRHGPGRHHPGPARHESRSIDGSGNHMNDPGMGAAGTPLLRFLEPAYGDGISSLAGDHRASAREISNLVNAQPLGTPANELAASDFLWQWGQFVDHDIGLTGGIDPPEPAFIDVPLGDPDFDPDRSGVAVIPFNRSIYDPASGDAQGNPRQQLNEITAWIDASNVYGSDDERAAALRALDGTAACSRAREGSFPTTRLASRMRVARTRRYSSPATFVPTSKWACSRCTCSSCASTIASPRAWRGATPTGTAIGSTRKRAATSAP
jgi:hypothetical protein